jgi:quercetin dioxygenase-like cupin family protein
MKASLPIAREERALVAPVTQVNQTLNPHIIFERGNMQAVSLQLKRGQLFQDNTSPVDTVIMMLDGQVTITTDEYEYPLLSKEIIRIPPYGTFSLQADSDSRIVVLK